MASRSAGMSNRGTATSLGSRFNNHSAFGNATFSNSRFRGGFGRGFDGDRFGRRGFDGDRFDHDRFRFGDRDFDDFGFGCFGCGFGGFGFGFGWGFGVGFGWDPWWSPWWGPGWGWGGPYAYYDPWWGWPPPPYVDFPGYPSYNYNGPWGAPYDPPQYNNNNYNDSNRSDSEYGPYSSSGADNNTDVTTNLASGTPVTDPITANVVEFAPSVLVYLKDGTMLVANDYWLQDGQFHYTVKYGGENTISMDQVDLQRSADENAKRGVKFSLKPKPAMNPNGTASNGNATGNQNRGSGATPATTPAVRPATRMAPVAA